MRFVNDIYFVSSFCRSKADRLAELANIINPASGRGVNFHQIEEGAGVKLDAGRARIARNSRHGSVRILARDPVHFAIRGFRDEARDSRFSNPSRPRKNIRMRKTSLPERIP